MEESVDFLEELLIEAEKAENSQQDAYYDLVLAEIRKIEDQIARNFEIAEQEIKIVNDWALLRSSKLQDRINWLATKLESFIRSRGAKTIDLPNGTLRIRKSQDKIEVTDIDAFLASARAELLTVIPEEMKPDLAAIKAFIKRSGKPPEGVTRIEGTDKFTYKLRSNGVTDDGNNEE